VAHFRAKFLYVRQRGLPNLLACDQGVRRSVSFCFGSSETAIRPYPQHIKA
jgi:hypothetical protein